MRRVNPVAIAATALSVLAAGAEVARAQSVTVFEGARLIVGDGRVIDNGTLVVDGARMDALVRSDVNLDDLSVGRNVQDLPLYRIGLISRRCVALLDQGFPVLTGLLALLSVERLDQPVELLLNRPQTIGVRRP